MPSKFWLTLAALIGACFLVASALALSEQAIDIANFAFSPSSVTVQPNTSITWTNQDSSDHTVTFSNVDIDSGNIAQGKTFTVSLGDPGHYTYHCNIHSFMTGSIDVQAPLTPRAWLPVINRP